MTVRCGPVGKLRTSGRSRSYIWPHDDPPVEYRSVTTIIGQQNKPALVRWAANRAAEYAVQNPGASAKEIAGSPWRERDKAANLGSLIHDAIDTGEGAMVDGRAVPYLAQMRHMLAEKGLRIVATEVPIFNRTYQYSGTCDAIVKGPSTLGEQWLLDWKTGKGVYDSMALQMAGYAHAEWAGYYAWNDSFEADVYEPQCWVEIEPKWSQKYAYVVKLSPDDWQCFRVPVGGQPFRTFVGLRSSMSWQDSLKGRGWWSERTEGTAT